MIDMSSDVTAVLRSGEDVLWTGRPSPGRFLSASDLPVMAFGVVWTGFAVVWEVLAITAGAPFFFYIWGGMFVAIGLGTFLGMPVRRKRMLARTTYLVTDRRVAVVERMRKKTVVTDLPLEKLPVQTSQRPDGSGSITFGADPSATSRSGLAASRSLLRTSAPGTVCFERLASVREVLDVIDREAARREANA
jgi:hypothetical protein